MGDSKPTSDSELSPSSNTKRSPASLHNPKDHTMTSETIKIESNQKLSPTQYPNSDEDFLDSSPLASLEPPSPALLPTKPEPAPSPIKSESSHVPGSPAQSRPETKPKSQGKAVSKVYMYQVPRRPAMNRDELKQCSSILKALKRHPDAGPFLEPVDVKKLQIPDYPLIIQHPMDLDTAEKKLNICDYDMVDEFFADIQRIFENCYLYNGRDAPISAMAHNLEVCFNRFKKDFSHASELLEQESAPHRAVSAVRASKSKQNSRKSSQSHLPTKDLPESSRTPSLPNNKKLSSKIKMPEHHYKFCQSLIKELGKNQYIKFSFPFLEPVDWKAMNLPDYPHIIKKPMDLKTIRQKFDANTYVTPFELEQDIRLMFANCYKYNSSSGQIYEMGKEFEDVFIKKWAQRPIDLQSKDNDGLSSDSTSSASPPVISKPVTQKSSRKASKVNLSPVPHIEPFTHAHDKSRKRKSTTGSKYSSALAERGRPSPPAPKALKIQKPPKKESSHKHKKPVGISYEQKKELSLAINNLGGDDLNVVVDMIHRSMPEIGRSQGEIELDIDQLDPTTLSTLYSYVMSTTNNSTPKPTSSSKSKLKGKSSRSSKSHGNDFSADLRHSRDLVSSKGSRQSDMIKSSRSSEIRKRPKSPLSSSSSSDSDSGSDSSSTALPNPTQSSRSNATSSLTSKGSRSKNRVPPTRKLDKKVLPDTSHAKVKAPDSSKSTNVSSAANIKHSPSDAPSKITSSKSRTVTPPVVSTPTKVTSRSTTVDASWARIQAQVREEQERNDKKRRMTSFEIAEEERLRLERRLKREEEHARLAAEKLKEVLEAARAKSQADRIKRLASVALRKDLLYQNRVMHQFEETLAREAREATSRSNPPHRPHSRDFPSQSSATPPPPSLHRTNHRRLTTPEDGELEEGELIE